MFLVYSKTNCPQCVKALGLIELAGLDNNIIKVDEDAEAYKFVIAQGHKSVPQIYKDDKLIGGVTELAAYIKDLKGAVNVSK